jgi:hypothetical protein
VVSLPSPTIRVFEGSEVTDHSEYLTVRTPANPEFWWGNFLLLRAPAARGDAGRWLPVWINSRATR